MNNRTPHFPKVGIDLVEISRFAKIIKKGKSQAHLLEKIFSAQEIKYCLSFKDAAPHFAGTFAAKEAASKALGTDKFPFVKLEIRHAKNGAPEVWFSGKKVKMSVSITHTSTLAAAMALAS